MLHTMVPDHQAALGTRGNLNDRCLNIEDERESGPALGCVDQTGLLLLAALYLRPAGAPTSCWHQYSMQSALTNVERLIGKKNKPPQACLVPLPCKERYLHTVLPGFFSCSSLLIISHNQIFISLVCNVIAVAILYLR